MDKMTVRDIEVGAKRVLVRVDFNVPLDEKTGAINDDSANDFIIGNNAAGSRTFDGILNDVRFYNTALSSTDIWKLYIEGTGKGLRGRYKFFDFGLGLRDLRGRF